MNKGKIWPTILVLSSTVLVFTLLLIYLNILLFKLKKEKIEAQSQNLVSQSFFAIPYNAEGLHNFVNELREQTQTEVPRTQLLSRLKDIFKEYSTVSSSIDTVFSQIGLSVDYEWTVSIPKFEIRDSDTTLALIDSKNKRSEELILYGKNTISQDASQYVFYKIGGHHFNQVNLYIEFSNIYSVIARQLIFVLIADVLLILLFAAAMRYSINTLIQQHKTVNLQTDLLNAVSHEFNTPLSSIQIGGQALLKLKEKADSNLIKEIANGIIRQQKYLKNLVDQILTLGVSESQKLILETSIYNANELIKDIGDKWMEGKNASDVIFKVEDISQSEIAIDPHLLKLALFNIFDNSLKYADKTPVEIKLRGEIQGKKINIIIEDNGPGMNAFDLKNGLKKFYRGRGSKNSKGRGLGLGLYLVNQIAKMHRGNCKIESNEGMGTKVIIALPVYNG